MSQQQYVRSALLSALVLFLVLADTAASTGIAAADSREATRRLQPFFSPSPTATSRAATGEDNPGLVAFYGIMGMICLVLALLKVICCDGSPNEGGNYRNAAWSPEARRPAGSFRPLPFESAENQRALQWLRDRPGSAAPPQEAASERSERLEKERIRREWEATLSQCCQRVHTAVTVTAPSRLSAAASGIAGLILGKGDGVDPAAIGAPQLSACARAAAMALPALALCAAGCVLAAVFAPWAVAFAGDEEALLWPFSGRACFPSVVAPAAPQPAGCATVSVYASFAGVAGVYGGGEAGWPASPAYPAARARALGGLSAVSPVAGAAIFLALAAQASAPSFPPRGSSCVGAHAAPLRLSHTLPLALPRIHPNSEKCFASSRLGSSARCRLCAAPSSASALSTPLHRFSQATTSSGTVSRTPTRRICRTRCSILRASGWRSL